MFCFEQISLFGPTYFIDGVLLDVLIDNLVKPHSQLQQHHLQVLAVQRLLQHSTTVTNVSHSSVAGLQ